MRPVLGATVFRSAVITFRPPKVDGLCCSGDDGEDAALEA